MNLKHLTAMFLLLFVVGGCSDNGSDAPTTGENEKPEEKPETSAVFAKGADISWVTEMEAKGLNFYNSKGEERECTALMKELGMNSIRLRVWVNPDGGWNGKADVVKKALRAKKLGMRVMVDFHYSDSWADPGKQNIPAAWASYNFSEMKAAVTAHTEDVLSALKAEGVDVAWVQVGNETTNGMLWDMGRCDLYPGNYAGLTNAGYDAVKKVYPEAQVIVHLDRGNILDHYTWIFGELSKYGGKWDMIGMSLYPSYVGADWNAAAKSCLDNIATLNRQYGCHVMICEVGFPWDSAAKAKEVLTQLISEARESGICDGVFYWEPEAPNGYNGGYSLGAFADNRPTVALDAFKD